MEGYSSCRDGGVVAIIYRWLGQMRGLRLDPGPHISPPSAGPGSGELMPLRALECAPRFPAGGRQSIWWVCWTRAAEPGGLANRQKNE